MLIGTWGPWDPPSGDSGAISTRLVAMNAGYELTRRLAEEALATLNPAETAIRVGALLEGEWLSIAVCRRQMRIRWGEDGVTLLRDGVPLDAPEWDAILLMHHLARSDASAPTGDWVPFRALPGAMGGYSSSFQKRSSDILLKRYGGNPGGFARAAEAHGGRSIEEGGADYSYVLLFMPRVPVLVQLWEADEEFDARAAFLFDRSAEGHLHIEDLTVAAQFLAIDLVRWVP